MPPLLLRNQNSFYSQRNYNIGKLSDERGEREERGEEGEEREKRREREMKGGVARSAK
jgi:hypothetical protein